MDVFVMAVQGIVVCLVKGWDRPGREDGTRVGRIATRNGVVDHGILKDIVDIYRRVL
jgi:hypothetical protein